MARTSKVTVAARPSRPSELENRDYYCCRCTKQYKALRNNFHKTQSPLYDGNEGYLPICKVCVEELFNHYSKVLGDSKEAIHRLCMKFDIYWNEDIYEMIKKPQTGTRGRRSQISEYIAKSNLWQFQCKSYDNTLDEAAQAAVKEEQEEKEFFAEGTVRNYDKADPNPEEQEEIVIPIELVDFWGGGLQPSFYLELDRRYKYWCRDRDLDTMDVGEQAVIKQICILEATINRDSAAGKSIDKNVNALNNLLGSANLKPVQQKKITNDAEAESTPFGVWIQKIENTRPIKDVDPELEDVDGIIKYINVWFLGHLCKMLKISNKYSHLYERELEALRVQRPEYEEDDEELMFEDIFERAAQSELEREEGGELEDVE